VDEFKFDSFCVPQGITDKEQSDMARRTGTILPKINFVPI